MLLEPFPKTYNYKQVSNFIAQADIRLTNLESVFSSWNCFASSYCGGQWVNAEPYILDEINKYGFNLYSCANNHSMDYSYDGLLSTIHELEKRKMPYAGIGKDLNDASKAVFYSIQDTGKKVALLSITSTFIDAARAGYENDYVPGRPGVNPLRVHTVYNVSPEHIQTLNEIAKKTFINGERDNARKIGSLPPEEVGSINFGGHFFKESEKEGKTTYCNIADLMRVKQEIEKARECCDYVIIAVHSHQIRKDNYIDPDYFMEEFCHSCIDAGACVVFGCGTHQLKPIEIYKGKPIFYSLGNFVFQLHKVANLPADFWDKYNIPVSCSVSDALAIKNKHGTVGLENNLMNYLSVIPYIEYDNNDMIKLIMRPIELSFDESRMYKGLPVDVSTNRTELLVDYLKEICNNYGTKLDFDGKHIVYSI